MAATDEGRERATWVSRFAGKAILAVERCARRLKDGQIDRERVEMLALERHRDSVRLRRRADSGDRFVVFSEQMARVESDREVLETLIEHAADIVGGFRAEIWSEAKADLLAPTSLQGPDIAASEDFASLKSMLEAAGAMSASVVGIGGGSALVLLERRSERGDEPRHWYLLRAMSTQARAALERLARSGEERAPDGDRIRNGEDDPGGFRSRTFDSRLSP